MVDGRLFLRYTSQKGGLDLGYEIEERMNLDGGSFTTVVAREEERDRVRHNPSGS